MSKTFEINTKDIIAVQVFLEKRRTRVFVGKLTRKKKDGKINYHFEYDPSYLTNKAAIPVGPELSLIKEFYDSSVLFPSFQDRIPSKENPAYVDYCITMGISVEEKDPIVLLCTIGHRGPSSFIFEPLFKENFTTEDLKNYRKELGLTIREFAGLFNISPGHLQRVEAKMFSGHDILERIERYKKYPEDTLDLIFRRGGVLHTDKKRMLIEKVKTMVESSIKKKD